MHVWVTLVRACLRERSSGVPTHAHSTHAHVTHAISHTQYTRNTIAPQVLRKRTNVPGLKARGRGRGRGGGRFGTPRGAFAARGRGGYRGRGRGRGYAPY